MGLKATDVSQKSKRRSTKSLTSNIVSSSTSGSETRKAWNAQGASSNAGRSEKTGRETGKTVPGGVKSTSVDHTPTTDYNGSNALFPLHPETLEEELEIDRKMSHMNHVLQNKSMKPKSQLPQVILYDNVNRERLLEIRLTGLRQAHVAAEQRAKRRQDTFMRKLEHKQKEWVKRDERTMAKLEPENVPELSFEFGRLYNKPDHPYQAAISMWGNKQQLLQSCEHARRRPAVLPQLTNRQIANDLLEDDHEDSTFITKPKRTQQRNVPTQATTQPGGNYQELNVHARRRRGRQRRLKNREWTSDIRFHELTSLLGERYSPKKQAKRAADGVTSAATIRIR